MSFSDAVKSVFLQYATFSGRARRSEYWNFVLFNFAVTAVISLLTRISGVFSILDTIYALGVLVPYLAVTVRRLHDTGKSGWWLLISLIPIAGFIALLVFLCQDSKPDNQYGPNPKFY